ncbi:ABC transporter permease subunit [Virgibacillus flavescens]|uniref:ABC transporter permease subunit n=1 Tax=Virgibacillus flavescens TaxID=1611422 RepID=UPI003D35212D
MNLVKLIIYYFLGFLGICCISVFSKFLAMEGFSNPLQYFEYLGSFFIDLFKSDSWVYRIMSDPSPSGDTKIIAEYPLFDTLWGAFIYSMQIFLGAIILGFALALLLALLSNFLPKRLSVFLKKSLDILEAIPDVVIAVSLQALSIFIFQSYGLDLFRVAGYADTKIYFAPILTLSIIPMISLFKVLLFHIEEEFLKEYVLFLRSKGIKKLIILLRHMLKNVLITSFQHTKVIIWATLSSQFIIEYLFNIPGITDAIIDSFTPMTIAVSLTLLFTPFFFFFHLMEMWLYDTELVNEGIVVQDKRSLNLVAFFKTTRFTLRLKQRVRPLKITRYLWSVLIVHMKNIKFAIGILFFVTAISASFIYSLSTNDHVDEVLTIYEEDGTTIKSTPIHPPSKLLLLGSDFYGYDLLDMLLIGAKYTLLFGLLIAFLRVFIGFLGGVAFAFSLKTRQQIWLDKMADSIHFLPLTLIAYILLKPVLPIGAGDYSTADRIIIEVVILTILVLPLTTVLIGNDIKQHLLNKEFIMSATVLGGKKLHILFRHILPHIGPRLTILFGQQFIQVLLLFIHLGVVELFFGGTIVLSNDPLGPPDRSVTSEWAGLVAASKEEIQGGMHIWALLFPLIAFMLGIFAMQLIINGVKEVQQRKVGVLHKFPMRKNSKIVEPNYTVTKESFEKMRRF